MRILPTAAKVFSSSQKISRNFKPTSIERAKQIANACNVINLSAISDNVELEMLASTDGIDVGEALLVATTQLEQDFYLLTSNKRFLKTLALSNFDNVKQRLQKRVICLEQLMAHLITVKDFDLICRRVVSADSCDMVVSDAFEKGRQTKSQDAVTVFNQATQDLRIKTGDLLIDSVVTAVYTSG